EDTLDLLADRTALYRRQTGEVLGRACGVVEASQDVGELLPVLDEVLMSCDDGVNVPVHRAIGPRAYEVKEECQDVQVVLAQNGACLERFGAFQITESASHT